MTRGSSTEPPGSVAATRGYKEMQKPTFKWSVSTSMLAIASLSFAGFGSNAASANNVTGHSRATDPLQLAAVLEAGGPNPSLGIHAGVIDRLTGTWDVKYTDYSRDGKVTHRTGELTFGWVMDGRVMQDLWVVNPSAADEGREVYSDLFFFDPKTNAWLSASVDPEHPSIARFTGHTGGDNRLVFESHDFGTEETRWSYNDIRSDSFVFRAEESGDGGRTWKVQSEYHMSRRHEAGK